MPFAILMPESPIGAENTRQPIDTWKLVLSIVLTIVSAAIYVAIFVGGAEFRGLFHGFGTDLPVLTRFVLATHKYYGVLILVGLIPCVALLRNRNRFIVDSNRLFMWVVASFGLSFFLMGVFVIAMYLPIFQLGAEVS
jgi:cytochrome b561